MIYYVADTETTGVRPTDKLVEIAWFEVDEDLNIIDKFSSLIDPVIPISPAASAMHHLTSADVEKSPTVEELFSIVLRCREFKPATLICHNVAFDRRYWPKNMNITEYACTLRGARKLYPALASHAMQVLRYEFGLGFGLEVSHRAMGDVEILFELLKLMLRDSKKTLPEFLEWVKQPVAVQIMPFGKYKGCKLSTITPKYVDWLLSTKNLDPDLRASLIKL